MLALQTGPTLAERGLQSFIGQLVGLAMCRELAPVMMAVLIAGRIGSAMAAEIGSMQVYQEIDALRTMNINPVHYLVLPRLLAISVALPILVVFSMLVGWLGGALVSVINHADRRSRSMATSTACATGSRRWTSSTACSRASSSPWSSGSVSCHQGLSTIGGPRGIGRSVTKAVVNSIVLILMLDYFLTRVLMHLRRMSRSGLPRASASRCATCARASTASPCSRG